MTDLDDALRSMLRERAHDIQTLPVGLAAPADAPDDGDAFELLTIVPTRHHRWPVFAAAAAIVALIAGSLIAALAPHSRHSEHRAAPTKPTTVTLPTCTATVPSAWAAPVTAGTVSLQGEQSDVTVEGVTTDGTTVVTYSRPVTTTLVTRYLGTVAAGANTIRPLYTVARAATMLGLQVTVQGNTVLLEVSTGKSNGAGTVHPVELSVFDLHTRARTIVARTTATARIAGDAYLQDGHVYWPQRGKRAGSAMRIRDYDIAERTTRTDGADPGLALSQTDAGVSWARSDGTTVTRASRIPNVVGLPVNVARAALRDELTWFVSDGQASAWARGATIGWWSPNARHVVQVRGIDASEILAVAGPLIVYLGAGPDPTAELLDVRTGAIAPIAAGVVHGLNGMFVGAPVLARPDHAPAGDLMRVAVKDLPKISC